MATDKPRGRRTAAAETVIPASEPVVAAEVAPAEAVAIPEACSAGTFDILQAWNSQVQELEALRQSVKGMKMFVLTINDAMVIDFRQYDSLLEATEYVRGRIRDKFKGRLFVFHGHRWQITKGPNRQLVGPLGQKIPLSPEADLGFEEDGLIADPVEIQDRIPS